MTFRDYLQVNFFLLTIAIALILLVIRDRSKGVRLWYVPILICGLAVMLGISDFMDEALKDNESHIFWVCFFSWIGYSLRPLILYLFIRQFVNDRRILWPIRILVILNVLLYASVLFYGVPGLGQLTHYYQVLPGGGLYFSRGPLGYTSHILSGVLLVYLVFVCLIRLPGQHRYDAIALLICAAFIVLAVVFETMEFADNLLNTTIAITCLFNYLHLHSQANKKDALTGLFERKSYYEDVARMRNSIHGVIQIDMNSLKELNDTKGHEAGDEALKSIANVLSSSISHRMYLYRMGGDEFMIIDTSSGEADLLNTCQKINAGMNKTPYHISVGYAYRKSLDQTFEEISKNAEVMMYKNKADYYARTGKDRRVR